MLRRKLRLQRSWMAPATQNVLTEDLEMCDLALYGESSSGY
jgi:hypothetical protein